MRGDIFDDIGQSSRDWVDLMRSQLRRSTIGRGQFNRCLSFPNFPVIIVLNIRLMVYFTTSGHGTTLIDR